MNVRRIMTAIGVCALLTFAAIDWTLVPALSVSNVTEAFSGKASKAHGVLYWVPEGTSLHSMSALGSDVYACSSKLTSWLNQHGSRVLSPQLLLVNNVSAKRQRVTFGMNDSAIGERQQPGFYVQCGLIDIYQSADAPSALAPRKWDAFRLNLLPEGGVAAETFGTASTKGSSSEFTLRPGEQVGLTLLIQGPVKARGSLALLSTDSNAHTSVPIPILSGQTPTADLVWPGLPPWASLLVHPLGGDGSGGQFYCVPPGRVPSDKGDPCSTSQILSDVKEIGRLPAPSAAAGLFNPDQVDSPFHSVAAP